MGFTSFSGAVFIICDKLGVVRSCKSFLPLSSNRFAEFGKRYRCEGEGGDGQPLIYIEHGHIEQHPQRRDGHNNELERGAEGGANSELSV